MTRLQVNVLCKDGVRRGLIEGFSSLRASVRWRGVGSWQMTGSRSALAPLVREGRGIVLRVDGVTVLSGPMVVAETFSDGTAMVSGVDDTVWLHRRLALTSGISPFPESLDYGVYDPSETVIYDIVNDNVGPLSGVRQKYVLAEDGGRGSTQVWKVIGQPVGDVVRQIVEVEGWGWRALWQASGQTLFSVVVPRDLTDSVRFSDVNGSLSSWERRVVAPSGSFFYVAGERVDGDRTFVTVSDTDDWGRIERFIDHRESVDDGEGELTVVGEAGLQQYGPVDSITAVSRPVAQFGLRDWRIGDLVTVEAGGIRRSANVVGFDVVDDTVAAVLSDGRDDPVLPSLARISDLERRMARQDVL